MTHGAHYAKFNIEATIVIPNVYQLTYLSLIHIVLYAISRAEFTEVDLQREHVSLL